MNGTGISNSWKIALLAAGGFLIGTSELVVAGILDVIAADLQVSVAVAGQLVTVFALVIAVGAPLLVALTSRMERKKLLIYTLVVFILGNFIAFISSGIELMMLSRVVLAMSMGVYLVVSLAVAAHLSAPGKQGRAIAAVIMGFSTSLVLGVPIGRLIASYTDWRYIFAGIGLLAIPTLIAIAKAVPVIAGQASVPFSRQLALFKEIRITSGLLATLFWILGYSVVFTYISPYLIKVVQLEQSQVSLGIFVFGLFSIAGARLGGYGTDKWGVPRTLLIGLFVHAAILLLLAFLAKSLVGAFLLLIVWALSAWSTVAVQQFYLITLAPRASDLMLSLNNSILQLGMAFGAAIGGFTVNLFSEKHIGWVGAVSVLIAFFAAGFSLWLSRRERPGTTDISLAD
ncbi:MFS transporter [Paenibacillus hamazuiensis]|uniref:MFS transporter n=1 Tax=Paenibacillus hamazuiensis TaxID=2936508 RepID=UPI0020104D16|nr:MFS transporter [Paenibacillus hamazuiensis]